MVTSFLFNLILGIFMIWSGYQIYDRKKYNWLAGYNSMTEEQRGRVNIKRVSLAAKLGLYFMGISIAIIPATLYLLGFNNLSGKVYPWVILPTVFIILIVSILSTKWK